MFYAKNDTLSIIKHTEKDVIFPKNLKVVYKGIYNYLSIEVPNCKSFTATGIGLNLESGNVYILSPHEGLETIINVEIILKNNKKVSEKHIFKIKDILRPKSRINFSDSTYVKMTKNQLKKAIISVDLGDKHLKIDFKVVGFNLKISGKECIVIDGNKIDDKTFQIINKYCSRSDEITIFSIKAKCSMNVSCLLISPLLVKVI